MNYAIKFTTFNPNKTAEKSISTALGFDTELSHATIISLFSETAIDGKFTSKKKALHVAEKIRNRGAFGGFGKFMIGVEVVEA